MCVCVCVPAARLTGIFWAYSLPLGVSIPDVWHFRAGFPSSLSRGGKRFSYEGRKPEETPRATPPPVPVPVPRPAPGGRSPGGGNPVPRGRPGPHQLGVERCGEAVDPARVPDHPVEEIGHAQEAATGVSRGADQQPQQRQPRGGTCGELGVGGGGGWSPGPARSARSPSALTCSPRRPGEGHDSAEPAARLGWAGVAPASPIYICRLGTVSGGKPFLS